MGPGSDNKYPDQRQIFKFDWQTFSHPPSLLLLVVTIFIRVLIFAENFRKLVLKIELSTMILVSKVFRLLSASEWVRVAGLVSRYKNNFIIIIPTSLILQSVSSVIKGSSSAWEGVVHLGLVWQGNQSCLSWFGLQLMLLCLSPEISCLCGVGIDPT